eukprot:349601-Chlamydomonas_euryale.AAC.7
MMHTASASAVPTSVFVVQTQQHFSAAQRQGEAAQGPEEAARAAAVTVGKPPRDQKKQPGQLL